MRDASASQSTAWTGTSPSACRSSAPSASSRGGSTAANGLNVSLSLDSAIFAPKETRDHAAQMPPCLVQVPPHRARRKLQHLPDLAAREPVHVEHRHDQALPLRERRERLLQDLSRVAPLRLLERRRRLAHAVRLRLHAATRT